MTKFSKPHCFHDAGQIELHARDVSASSFMDATLISGYFCGAALITLSFSPKFSRARDGRNTKRLGGEVGVASRRQCGTRYYSFTHSCDVVPVSGLIRHPSLPLRYALLEVALCMLENANLCAISVAFKKEPRP